MPEKGGGRPVTKAEKVAHELRQDITSGRIAPGGRLEQRDIAARYGTSPTPAREALMRLAAEGILVHTPNAGMTVAEIGSDRIEELNEIFLLRKAVESMVTGRAHEYITRARVAELQRIHAAFTEATEERDLAGLRTLNYSFHMQIYRTAAGDRIMRMIEQLWMLFPWDTVAWNNAYMAPDERQGVLEHGAVLDALAGGTAEEAADAMAEHIAKSYRYLVLYLSRRSQDDDEDGDQSADPASAR